MRTPTLLAAAAIVTLASSLMGQHRIAEAHEVAGRLVGLDSSSVSARALLGEIQVEVGRYADAARTFGGLRMYQRDLTVAPRLAR